MRTVFQAFDNEIARLKSVGGTNN